MSDLAVWTVIVAAGVGTYAIRASFLAVAERAARVPPVVERVLRMIPPAALSAIVALELADHDAPTAIGARLVAAAVAFGITWWRNDLILALVVGMAVVIGLDHVV